ncbi:MAG: hypothetical protein LBT44_06655 [Clostridiales bacterium]|jgi:hypothetical protein|nr:hypothetical protein [Clostridiales bacterium]
MAWIGVVGEKSQELAAVIADLFERAGQPSGQSSGQLPGQRHTLIDLERQETELPMDVLAALENSRTAQKHIAALGEGSMLIMNPDHKDILEQAGRSRGLLITFGLNNKDCVTASSVMENEIQICVQRDLPTLSGGKLEQQEFGVRMDTEKKDPEVLLAALTTVLICGASVEKLQVLNQSRGE